MPGFMFKLRSTVTGIHALEELQGIIKVCATAAAELAELRRREQDAGIVPDRALDEFMEGMSIQVRAGARAVVRPDVVPCHSPDALL